MDDKKALRRSLKAARRAFVNSIPSSQRGLIMRRPPAPLAERVPEGAIVGVYYEHADETPATHYARWFHERGHRIALPWLADRTAPMQFRQWDNPFAYDEGLESDPFADGTRRSLQPAADADCVIPDVLFCPLVGFSANGGRLGMGGGHYDRWLAAHRPSLAVGLAWDCQLVDDLPSEAHDAVLDAVVTPTRIYWKDI
ncbi:MAG: 5-formyltetrahydrofolate cyclo-ligase [Novosphingobium sp.]